MVKLSRLAALLVLTAGCAPDPRYLRVVQEARSPDGSLTAVYVEQTDGGAAVGTLHAVYVFDGKTPTRYSERVFGDECITDVRVSWLGPKELRISYGAPSRYEASLGGPWWTFGRVPHGLVVRLVPHTAATSC